MDVRRQHPRQVDASGFSSFFFLVACLLRHSFLSSLIPPTPDTLTDVLVQGGLPHDLTSIDDPSFLHLVDETRAFISSADFGRVLEKCLDQATDVLFDGLRRTLFIDSLSSVDAANSEKVRLAGLLPGVARWCHSAVHGTPNELVEVSLTSRCRIK